jgi:arylsulfatase A-like enzyme
VDDLDADCPGTSHGDDPAAIFAELVQCLDDRVGRLVDGIPTDTLENTLIVFLGDNGTEAQLVEGPFVPSADRPYGKGSTYETGVRVPLVVVSGHRLIEWRACLDAGVLDGGTGECPTTDTRIAEPGRVVHEPVAAVDLPATLAELAGAAMSPAVDSVSFADCLTDPDCTRDRPLWSETFQVDDDGALTMGNGGYREGDDKLVLAWDAERACLAAELYDLDADPYETTDRAAQAPDLVTTLVGGVHGLGVAWLDGKPLCDGDTSL